MKVGFTGTRRGMSGLQRGRLWELLYERGATELGHGDCVGADSEAHDVARDLALRVVVFPPSDPKFRAWRRGDEARDPAPYLERDRAIVDWADVLVAAPRGPEVLRSGTWATVRRARRRGVEVVVVGRDGRLA